MPCMASHHSPLQATTPVHEQLPLVIHMLPIFTEIQCIHLSSRQPSCFPEDSKTNMRPPTATKGSPCTETATAMRDRSPPHHTIHFSNTSLQATSSHAGLLANFADTTGARSHQTVALNCRAEALPSDRCANTLYLTAFHNHEHLHLESSTWQPPSSTQFQPQ